MGGPHPDAVVDVVVVVVAGCVGVDGDVPVPVPVDARICQDTLPGAV